MDNIIFVDLRKDRGNFFKFVGIWSEIDEKEIIKTIYEGRKDKAKLKRKLPNFT